MQLYVFTFLVAVATIAVVTTAAPANDHANEYDYEEDVEPAPAPVAPPAARGRLSLLNTRGQRGPSPLIGSRGAAAKQPSTPKPVEQPAEPEESEDLEEDVEEGAEEAPGTTTTEAPKKSLVRGGVRPFRSNEDLLAALKRRREQQLHGGSPKVVQVYPTPSSALPGEDKASRSSGSSQQSVSNGNGGSVNGRRRFSNKSTVAAAAGSSSDPVVAVQPDPARRSPSRRFNSRSKPPAPVSESAEVDEEATPKPKNTFRRRI